VSITLPPIAFSYPLWRVHARSSPVFRLPFITLITIPAKQLNSNTLRSKGSSLVMVLALSKSLPYRTKRHFFSRCAFPFTPFIYLCSPCLLLCGQNANSSRAANHMATGHHRKVSPPTHRRPQHSLELTLRHQARQPHDDNASHCGLVSCFFSVVHLLHTPMVVDAVAYAHLFYFRFWFFRIVVRVFYYCVNDVFSPCNSCGMLDSVNSANKRNISRCSIG
jgi:hypothetical protein